VVSSVCHATLCECPMTVSVRPVFDSPRPRQVAAAKGHKPASVHFNLNVISTSTKTGTAFPSKTPGSNFHSRTAAAHTSKSGSSDLGRLCSKVIEPPPGGVAAARTGC
jgi:hypothetical protein